MKRQILIISLLSVIISGCATYATGPLFTPAPPAQGQKSTLYVFRSKTMEAINPVVKIDGEPFVKLTVMGYSYAYVLPGIRRIMFDSGAFNMNFITEIRVKEGEDYYLQYSGNGMGHQVSEIPKGQALDIIKDYRYIEPINLDFTFRSSHKGDEL